MVGDSTVGPAALGVPRAAAPVRVPSARGAVPGWIEGRLLALDVPIRSQFDNSEYQASNCGPTSLAMVLEGFGVDVPTASLRGVANLLQGTYDRETGIALDHLAQIARQAGLRALGLRDGNGYRRWSVDEVRAQVRTGHPVITLVKMRELPDHAGSSSDTDHYVVVTGLDGDRLLINDPALPGDRGFRRPLSHAELERAWMASSIPGQAVAIAAAEGVPELVFPDPITMVAPGTASLAPVNPASDLQPAAATPTPLPGPGAPQPAAAPLPQIVIVITPAAPQVFVINVASMSTPVPTQERWARPGRIVPTAVPVPRPAGGGAAPGSREEALVLAESTPLPPVPPLRWPVRGGILLVAGLLLRRILR
ncbi:MAG TPA: C39 family peptidase [Chloroflexota bacterium]